MPSTKSSITITFGGVNFLLEPKAVGSELSFVNGKNSDEVVLNLNNFSGALVVSLAETKKENKSIIEEEPLSPPGASVQKVSPRQQQLSFGASTAKHNYCTVSVGKVGRQGVPTFISYYCACSHQPHSTKISSICPLLS